MKQDIVGILKRVTAIVKVAPFAIALLYVLLMIIYLLDEDLTGYADMFCYTSPAIIVLLLLLSKTLKLCVWHRLQCCLPLLPYVVDFIDNCLYQLNIVCCFINTLLILLICLLSLINAYFVFYKLQCCTRKH
jgi:hypothetical protein